jgi:hypothetical protein
MRGRPLLILFSSSTLLGFMISSGCDEIPNEPARGELFIAMEKDVFAEGETAVFSVVNNSSASAYLEFCGSFWVFSIEEKSEQGWESYGGTICHDSDATYMKEVPPETSYGDSLAIRDEGQYRIRIPYGWTDEIDSPYALASGEFLVQ